jgi:hypothetical protein
MTRTLALIAITAIVSMTVTAADHSNLEEGLPTELTDAYPIGFMGREIQAIFRYERGEDGVDSFEVQPRLEFGWVRNMQFSVHAPILMGEIEPDGFGDTTVEAFWNLNQETLHTPALALAGAVDLPTGPDDHGLDPTVKVILSKLIGRTWQYHAVHLNLIYQFNDNRQSDERAGRYKAVVGYSGRVNNETIFVADVVREQEMEDDEEINLIELGLRIQATPRTVVSLGAGFGISDESPDVRGVLGIQIAF